MANRLINEQSLYLQQHAHNPVNWYPWGDEAFDEARRQNKPVLVSIGYAACHWCHVMERESFEDVHTAAIMNEHFICIKVDREEHPDVDHMYMDAVQAISGSGGWPLNVFVTPDRLPYYGGTYFPPRPAYSRPSWTQVLLRMQEVWEHQHDEVAAQAGQMLSHLQQASSRSMQAGAATWDAATITKAAENMLAQADLQKGGFGNAPKFPGTMAITFLLEYYHFTGHEPSLAHALKSLDAMIEGGIYDQVGGGFARYATDRDWLIPHFEKMLYDNALLVLSLCDAWQVSGRERYREVIEETIGFVNRELRDASGGLWCALDADSEGVEGKYYTWTWTDWQQVVSDTTGLAARYFGVSEEGNWEERNILHVPVPLSEVAAAHGISEEAAQTVINRTKAELTAALKKRIRPATDDKCLLSWNALMSTALSKAGTVLGRPDYLAQAAEHMRWMLSAYTHEGSLMHTWKDGVARIPAMLDDYAYLIQAMLQLAAANGDGDLIVQAADFTDHVIKEFGMEDGLFYYTSATAGKIPVRKVDIYDGATPSANSVMAANLITAGMCMERTDWISRAEEMVRLNVGTASRYPYSFALWATVAQRMHIGNQTVIVSGGGAGEAVADLNRKYLPAAFIVTFQKEISELPVSHKGIDGNNLSIFVCSKDACLPPAGSVLEALSLITR